MSYTFTITDLKLTFEELKQFLDSSSKIELSETALKIVNANRAFLDRKIKEPDAVYYGINTGFGALCDVTIAPDQLEQLQQNLVMSHACGMGDEVPHDIVRLMMLLKVKGLSLGYSGISIETLKQLIDLYNHEIYPVVWDQGSLGASGDLSPLAHLCLPLLGMGAVRYKGEVIDAASALSASGLSPIGLRAKEGLALLNGTQFMSAYGCYIILEAERIQALADLCAAVSIDAFDAQLAPFHHEIHRVRNHQGQIDCAAHIRQILQGSPIADRAKDAVQDPYSFRCVPQVHGAVRSVLAQVKDVFEHEINAVTDNPLIFEGEDMIVSGGNFHGEPLALALDYMSLALCELGSISERRTFQLLSGKRGLPKFLVADPGLHSGLMIPQYTAASIVSMNKQLASPSSVDSITSSDGQEDHVSMGANAAVKALKILRNIESVLAIEFLTAMQALDFRLPTQSSPTIEGIRHDYRRIVSFIDRDRILHNDMQATLSFMKGIKI